MDAWVFNKKKVSKAKSIKTGRQRQTTERSARITKAVIVITIIIESIMCEASLNLLKTMLTKSNAKSFYPDACQFNEHVKERQSKIEKRRKKIQRTRGASNSSINTS